MSGSGLQVGAVIQGLGAALVLITILVVYLDRMSKVGRYLGDISDSIEDVDESLDDVHSDMQQVDLKDMEKTTNKLETYLDIEMKNSYGSNQAQQSGQGFSSQGGQNSVIYGLDDLDMDVTISYVGNPEWHAGLKGHDNLDMSETVFNIDFSDEIDSQAVVGRLIQSERLLQTENEVFSSGSRVRLSAESPYRISASIPGEDFQKAAEWIEVAVECAEEEITKMQALREEFDQEVASRLPGETQIK